MPVSKKESKVEHNKLFLRLNETFSPESSNFLALQRAARSYLGHGTVERCKTIEELAEKLQQGGHIKIGEYSSLKQMVKDAKCDVDEIIEVIEETEKKIKKIEEVKNDAGAPTPSLLDTTDTAAKHATQQNQIVMDSNYMDAGVVNLTISGNTAGASAIPDTTGKAGKLEKPQYTTGKGLCLILNFFSKERTGTEEDVKSLESFWQSVGCEVKVEEDLAKENVIKKLTECRAYLNNSFVNFSYFICAILSHGDQKGIRANDGEQITLTEIMDMFKNDKMENFSGKPKIFLVQACRGGQNQAGHTDHSDDEIVDISDLFPAKVPTDADILLACATTPGYKAFRRDHLGSWFIQELTKHLGLYHETEHLEEILISVRHIVGFQYETIDKVKQMPCTWSTLTKRFYV